MAILGKKRTKFGYKCTKKAEFICFIDKFSTIQKNTKIFKKFIYYER